MLCPEILPILGVFRVKKRKPGEMLLITAPCIYNQQCMLRCLCVPSHAVLDVRQRKVLLPVQKFFWLFPELEMSVPCVKESGGSGSSVPLRERLRAEGPLLLYIQQGPFLTEHALLHRAPCFWGTAYSQVPGLMILGGQETARKAIAYVKR